MCGKWQPVLDYLKMILYRDQKIDQDLFLRQFTHRDFFMGPNATKERGSLPSVLMCCPVGTPSLMLIIIYTEFINYMNTQERKSPCLFGCLPLYKYKSMTAKKLGGQP